MTSPTSTDEYERLVELSEMDLDYSNHQENLQDLTNLASHIVGTRVSLVNLIDNFTQWSVANTGIEIQQMPRKETVCQYTILEDDELEIKDLRADDRFNKKNYVTQGPRLRYYYGVPLTTTNGHNIGALCVLDPETKDPSPEDKDLLNMIANQVVRRLEALKKIQQLQEKVDELYEKQRKVSHDIRNPISGIIGITQMMEEEIENEQIHELQELVEMVQEGSKSLMELVDEIMDRDEEEQKPGRNEFDCGSFCKKISELYHPQAKSKGVKLTVEKSKASDKIIFSKARLLQIIGNLITNSIKFTEEGGSVDVQIDADKTEQHHKDNYLNIRVSDTGVGMSDEKIEEILQGEAESEGGTGGEKGYGFGLSLVRHLVQQAEGEIELESEEGKGTEFRITLPV